jgi:hypothetical protein
MRKIYSTKCSVSLEKERGRQTHRKRMKIIDNRNEVSDTTADSADIKNTIKKYCEATLHT